MTDIKEKFTMNAKERLYIKGKLFATGETARLLEELESLVENYNKELKEYHEKYFHHDDAHDQEIVVNCASEEIIGFVLKMFGHDCEKS